MSAPGKLVRSSRWKSGPSKGQRPLGIECCVAMATVVAKRTQRLAAAGKVWSWCKWIRTGLRPSTGPGCVSACNFDRTQPLIQHSIL
jgi:hypothetical protein